MNNSYGVAFAIDKFRAGNFADNIRWIATLLVFTDLKRASRLSSTAVATISRTGNRFLASKNILVLRFWNYQINRELG